MLTRYSASQTRALIALAVRKPSASMARDGDFATTGTRKNTAIDNAHYPPAMTSTNGMPGEIFADKCAARILCLASI
jgi:hypothetical protein